MILSTSDDFSFGASGTPIVTVTLNENSISFSPLGASGGSGNGHMVADDHAVLIGKVENNAALDHLTTTGSNTITYSNAFAGADLVYVLANQGLKEYIVLNSSASPNAFSFLFELNGLTMQTVDGFTHFVNGNGETVFTLGSLFAVDANGKPTDALTYDFVPVKGNDDQVIVTVTLDNDYLTAADRVFPVVIDPTVMISSSQTADTCVCEGYPSTNYYTAAQLRTGYDSDYGIRRSYIRFNIPSSISADRFVSASLDIEKVSGSVGHLIVHRVTEDWVSSMVNWQNKPDYGGVAVYASLYKPGSSWYTANVTNIVRSWLNGTYYNYGFLLKDFNESDPDIWGTWYSSDASSPHKPELHITYRGAAFSIESHLDLHFPTTMTAKISEIVSSASHAFQRQFGVSLIASGYPISTSITDVCNRGTAVPCISACSTNHHIEIWSYLDYLDSIASSGEVVVLWSDRSGTEICNHETGSCVKYTNATYGLSYPGNQGIVMVDIPSEANTENKRIAVLTIILIHEMAHYFGLSEKYFVGVDHTPGDNYGCAMDLYHANDYVRFYEAIMSNEAYAFCSACQAELAVLISNY